MTYLLEFILTVALYPVIVVILGLLMLIGLWAWWAMIDKLHNLVVSIKVLFFRAMSIGGMCSVTLCTALGLCAVEKESEKSDKDKKDA